LVARDRLQDNPGVMRDFPQFGIKLPPHFVGSMAKARVGPQHDANKCNKRGFATCMDTQIKIP
jgi:hypothetical protein